MKISSSACIPTPVSVPAAKPDRKVSMGRDRRLTSFRITLAVLAAVFLGHSPAWAITLSALTPTFASTAGGTVLTFRVSGTFSTLTATIDGVPVTLAVNPGRFGILNERIVVAPAHAVGSVNLAVTADGNPAATASAIIGYVDMPVIGAATPIERVSLSTAGMQGTARGNGFGVFGGSASGDGRYVLFGHDTDLGLGDSPPNLPLRWYLKDRTGPLSVVTSVSCDCPGASLSLDGSRNLRARQRAHRVVCLWQRGELHGRRAERGAD